MSQLIPFNETAKLPAFLGKRTKRADDLKAGVGLGMVSISIEGKKWTIIRGKDDRKSLMNPKDPESFASSINLIILKASPNLSRIFYEKTYVKGEDARPDCSSVDGVKPDTAARNPQAKSCASCPHSAWGSGANGKGFRCANHRRLAVANPGVIDEPMLLRVPGGSLKNLALFADMLDKRGVPYDGVVAKIGFDPDEPTPKLTFEPIAFVSDEMYETVVRVAESDEVARILGLSLSEDEAAPVTTVGAAPTIEEVAEAVEEPAPKKAAKKAEPAPEPTEIELEEVAEAMAAPVADLAEERAKKAEKAEAKKAAPKAAGGDDLDDLLAGFDD